MASRLLVAIDRDIVERHLAALDEYKSPRLDGEYPRMFKELPR